MTRAILILALLLLGGCVSDHDSGVDVSSPTASRSHFDDPDKPRQMCEPTSIAGESKTVCY